MRYDADHKARTRVRVLEEAAKAIRTEGPSQIGVAGVMARAGLTHGGFYAHFESKDDLVAAAMAEMFVTARALFAEVTAGLEPREALRTYVRFYLSRAHRDAPESGCPLPVLAGDLPRLSDAARRCYSEGVSELTRLTAALLSQLGQADAAAVASSVLAEMIGALSLSRAVADPAQSDAILRHSRAAVLSRLPLEDIA